MLVIFCFGDDEIRDQVVSNFLSVVQVDVFDRKVYQIGGVVDGDGNSSS